MNEAEMIKRELYNMTEEEFERFNSHFPADVQHVFTAMRFFHKMFNDPEMYNAVCESVGEAAYETLREE